MRMSEPEPLLVKAANREFNRWANFLFRRPYTTRVVAEFVDEIEDAFAKIRDHPDRYPLEGYSNTVFSGNSGAFWPRDIRPWSD